MSDEEKNVTIKVCVDNWTNEGAGVKEMKEQVVDFSSADSLEKVRKTLEQQVRTVMRMLEARMDVM